jgi:hypothetical protein
MLQEFRSQVAVPILEHVAYRFHKRLRAQGKNAGQDFLESRAANAQNQKDHRESDDDFEDLRPKHAHLPVGQNRRGEFPPAGATMTDSAIFPMNAEPRRPFSNSEESE